MTRKEEEDYIENVTKALFDDNISPMNGPDSFAEAIEVEIEDL